MLALRPAILAIAICLNLSALFATQAGASGGAASFPGAEWPKTTPAEAGWDAKPLAEARAFMQRAGTASFVVVQHGVVVDSSGDIGRRLELHSVRKSLLSALIGVAVGRGTIRLGDTLDKLGVDDAPPSLSPEEKQATVRELLQSRSGVYHTANYETAGERRQRPERGSHAPGTFWYYNNWDFNALGAIYEHAVGESIFQAFQDRIANPLAMQDYRPSDGRYENDGSSQIPAYPFRMSARDLARFGLLYLRGGRWRGEQVVPASWVAESTRGWSQTHIQSGYGYLWWTGFQTRRVSIMDLPPGGFWADGAKGQFVVVDPADDLVVVHQTDGATVTERQMGHLMSLILSAAHARDPGQDPDPSGE
jgi:CubicO group peptidase (beta-lactamase class C family)